MPKTVAIDFDGVLAQYDGWKGEEHLGEPMAGAREFCQRVLDAGYRIAIHTTRKPLQVEEWWKEHHFPATKEVMIPLTTKPTAVVYIDDRAYRFTGNWQAAWEAITQPAYWEGDDGGSPD